MELKATDFFEGYTWRASADSNGKTDCVDFKAISEWEAQLDKMYETNTLDKSKYVAVLTELSKRVEFDMAIKDRIQGKLKSLNVSEMVEAKKIAEETAAKLDDHLKALLNRKVALTGAIDAAMDAVIKPRKDEISQIEAEISQIMVETGMKQFRTDDYGAYVKDEISIKVVDREKALQWLLKHPEAIKKDIIKNSEINKLMKEGVVPDPDADGIDCNDSYQKISYRRR